jgi:hypothetical protein
MIAKPGRPIADWKRDRSPPADRRTERPRCSRWACSSDVTDSLPLSPKGRSHVLSDSVRSLGQSFKPAAGPSRAFAVSRALPSSTLPLSGEHRGEPCPIFWRERLKSGDDRGERVCLLVFPVAGATSGATRILSCRKPFVNSTYIRIALARQAGGHWFKSSSAHSHELKSQSRLHNCSAV